MSAAGLNSLQTVLMAFMRRTLLEYRTERTLSHQYIFEQPLFTGTFCCVAL